MSAVIGFQRWENLLFVHYEVDRQLLLRLVPNALTIDTFGDRAFLSILPFSIPESRPILMPRLLASLFPASAFVELNFRTYVTGPGGEPAIWFFSLDASSRMAVSGARLFYKLPYYYARMSHSVDRSTGMFRFSSHRMENGASCEARYRPIGEAKPAEPGSLDRFLVERYLLFSGSDERLCRARVRHVPYALQPVEVEHFSQNLLELKGLAQASEIPTHHYAARVEVKIERLESAI